MTSPKENETVKKKNSSFVCSEFYITVFKPILHMYHNNLCFYWIKYTFSNVMSIYHLPAVMRYPENCVIQNGWALFISVKKGSTVYSLL